MKRGIRNQHAGVKPRWYTTVLWVMVLLSIPVAALRLAHGYVYDESHRTKVAKGSTGYRFDPVVVFMEIDGKEVPAILYVGEDMFYRAGKKTYPYLSHNMPAVGTTVVVEHGPRGDIGSMSGEYTVLRKGHGKYYMKVKIFGGESHHVRAVSWYLADRDSFEMQYVKRMGRGDDVMIAFLWSLGIYLGLWWVHLFMKGVKQGMAAGG